MAIVAFFILVSTFLFGAGMDSDLTVLLFASGTCEECLAVKRDVVPRILESYGNRVTVTHIDIDEGDNFDLLLRYEAHYGVTTDESLKCFVGHSFLAGEEDISKNLSAVVAAELAAGNRTPDPSAFRSQPKEQRSGIGSTTAEPTERESTAPPHLLARQRFRGISIGVIILAGLADGINPCAFATIVFFVSLLTALHRSPREILWVGLAFSLAVFCTYLAMGVGAFHTLKALSVTSGVARALSLLIGFLALVLAVFSFRDALRYKANRQADELALRLPHAVRERISRIISRRLRKRNLVSGALGLGFVVSVLESVCTGQLYLPVITSLLDDPELGRQAHAWLVIYNFMFVLPLLAVLALTLRGLTSSALLSFSRSHIVASKVLLGIVFLAMAVVLLWGRV